MENIEKITSYTILQKIKNYILAHKIMSVVILLVAVWIGYWGYGKITSTSGDTRYVSSAVTKGTIISSITGSGQVVVSEQIDLKPRASGNTNVSGNITRIAVNAGDKVTQGQVLFLLDDRDAQKAVRNAKTSLETAQLDLEKFQQPPDTVAVLGIKKAIADAATAKSDAETATQKAITDAATAKSDAEKATNDSYRNLLNTSTVASSSDTANTQTPPTVSGTYTKGQEATITISVNQTGTGGYFTINSTPVGIASGLGTVTTVTPQPIGDSGLYIKFATTSLNQPNWIITLPNKNATAYNANYLAYQDAIDNQKKVDDTNATNLATALENQAKANSAADLTIAQNNKNLNDLYQPDALSLRAKQLVVEQAQNNLDDATQALADYTVTAPFSGIISTVPVQQGELVTSSTILATLITEKQFAEVSLNEVDVAKIKLGQKATLTFDAVPGLSISGKVSEIDSVGAVSQGVVTYIVKISFDTQDSSVKPGMSVSASIITDMKQDVLIVPNSAVKSQGGSNYVEMFDKPLPAPTDGLLGSISITAPNKIPVIIGLSNNSDTEIISGIKEGDEIVTRTILPTAAKTPTSSLLSGVGGNRTGGGAVRIPGN